MFGIKRKISYSDLTEKCSQWFRNKVYSATPGNKSHFILVEKLSALKDSSFKEEVKDPMEVPMKFYFHLDCIEFIIMIQAYMKVANDKQMKENGYISPNLYKDFKLFCIRNSYYTDKAYLGDEYFEKYYGNIVKDQQDNFLDASVALFNEIYTDNKMLNEEISIFKKYYEDSFTFWVKKFKNLSPYNKIIFGDFHHSKFDIGSM